MKNIKFYLVGGAVRDLLMGLEPNDLDFVVVGAKADGTQTESFPFSDYTMVGESFPVYLHNERKWEVAFARTEKKIGVGYKGFSVEWEGVTLEEDLSRRDLTINAMAYEVDWEATLALGEPVTIGTLIDPFGGAEHIKNKMLVNVSESFREDPLRVLRVARFAAKYPDFTISEQLVREMIICSKELNFLTPERVWAEVEKTFKCTKPTRFFEVLLGLHQVHQFDLFEDLFNLEKASSTNEHHQEANAFVHTMMVLEDAVQRYKNLSEKEQSIIFLACLMHDLGKWPTLRDNGNMHGHEKDGIPYVKSFCERFKVPTDHKKVALMMTEHHLRVHNILGRGKNAPSKANRIMQFFEVTGALQNPELFKLMLKACESDNRGRISVEVVEFYHQRPYLEECLSAVLNFNTKEISIPMLEKGANGKNIGQAIRDARISEIRKVFNKWIG